MSSIVWCHISVSFPKKKSPLISIANLHNFICNDAHFTDKEMGLNICKLYVFHCSDTISHVLFFSFGLIILNAQNKLKALTILPNKI